MVPVVIGRRSRVSRRCLIFRVRGVAVEKKKKILVGLAVAGALTGAALGVTSSPQAEGVAVVARTQTLVDRIQALPVADEKPREGYKRSMFRHWVDADRDGCDTREEVLGAEVGAQPPGSVLPDGACYPASGPWLSAYDGVVVVDPRKLDVDHLVPLAEAWDSGASGWDGGRRQAYANDLDHPYSLLAVTASSNRAKGDKDPAQWMPSASDPDCTYVSGWVQVKQDWDLSADRAEVDALLAAARACEMQPVS
jgi:hypothetical protein